MENYPQPDVLCQFDFLPGARLVAGDGSHHSGANLCIQTHMEIASAHRRSKQLKTGAVIPLFWA
jgi:hypothetical protein